MFCVKVCVNGNLWFENDIFDMICLSVFVNMTAVAFSEISFYRCDLMLVLD